MMLNKVIEINSFNENLIVEREREIENIHKGVKEISELFMDMSFLVSQQGDNINSISDNIESSAKDSGKAVIELERAKKYKNKYRVFKYFYFFIFILIIFIIIIWLISFNYN